MIEPGFPRWDDAMSTALVLTERHNKDMIDNVCREIAINRSFSEDIVPALPTREKFPHFLVIFSKGDHPLYLKSKLIIKTDNGGCRLLIVFGWQLLFEKV